jgi:hypothetical protein
VTNLRPLSASRASRRLLADADASWMESEARNARRSRKSPARRIASSVKGMTGRYRAFNVIEEAKPQAVSMARIECDTGHSSTIHRPSGGYGVFVAGPTSPYVLST